MNKKDKKFNILEIPRKYPVLFNIFLIFVALIIIVNGVLLMIDSFTQHGIYEVVPELKGKSISETEFILEDKGFKYEITDSTYSNDVKPGCVVEQEPKALSKVKPHRTIYLTINAVSPRTIAVPMIVDMSYRQGRAMLEGLGFKNITIDTIDSPYKDLIVGVKIDGKELTPGKRMSADTHIVISVGSGNATQPIDTTDVIDEIKSLVGDAFGE